MINWNIKNSKEKRLSWSFPSFEIQEYLLPIIYIGGQPFDEYGDTITSSIECKRMQNTIKYIEEYLLLNPKLKIRYETIHTGLVVLEKSLILETLTALYEATEIAIAEQKNLVFYGD